MINSQSKESIKQHLTPSVISKAGGIVNPLPSDEKFNPSGDWKSKYRIWTTYGRWETGNVQNGYLIIDKQKINSGGNNFIISVEQLIKNSTKKKEQQEVTNIITASINCKNDQLASPLSWKLFNKFYDEKSKLINEISIVDSIQNKQIKKNNDNSAVTSNWSLFEAVQRFNQVNELGKFVLLEMLLTRKRDHKIKFVGYTEELWNGEFKEFKCFEQTGNGILPTIYWIDGFNRLALVTSGYLAFILDDEAGELSNELNSGFEEDE